MVHTHYNHHNLLPFFLLLQQPFECHSSTVYEALCTLSRGKLAKMEIFIEQLQVKFGQERQHHPGLAGSPRWPSCSTMQTGKTTLLANHCWLKTLP
jgi:hypothetical protein